MSTFDQNLSMPIVNADDIFVQLRSAGLVVVECTMTGKIEHEPKRGDDWFSDLLLSSPIEYAFQSE